MPKVILIEAMNLFSSINIDETHKIWMVIHLFIQMYLHMHPKWNNTFQRLFINFTISSISRGRIYIVKHLYIKKQFVLLLSNKKKSLVSNGFSLHLFWAMKRAIFVGIKNLLTSIYIVETCKILMEYAKYR